MNVKKAITENESIKGPILYQFSTCSYWSYMSPRQYILGFSPKYHTVHFFVSCRYPPGLQLSIE